MTCKHDEPLSQKHKWMGLPLIRGCVNMVVMLKMGMETLDKSTQMLGVMEEEPSKFEKWLAEKLGASIDKVVMAVAMVLAVALSLFLFVALPSGMATLVGKGTDRRFVINLSAGSDAHRDSDRLYDRRFPSCRISSACSCTTARSIRPYTATRPGWS